jgi:hypothetical protein
VTNAFNWNDGTPSIFAGDRAARGTKNGESWSHVATKAVKTKEKATGKNPGTVYGISKAADAAIHPRRGTR